MQEKKSINIKKLANNLGTVAVGAADKAGKAAVVVAGKTKEMATEIAKGTKDAVEKAKVENHNRRMKKYNPLFEPEYRSAEFCLPNVICIVDDAVRRSIDVCKGAIGWREDKKGTEVLFLYDEFVAQSGLSFVPAAVCDEVYYVDVYNRNRFIKMDCVFQQSLEEKMAELEHIAYSLGAKFCSIEMDEREVRHDKKEKKIEGKETKSMVAAEEGYELNASVDSDLRHKGKSEAYFKGNDIVTEPELKWFAHDNNIKNLIEFRCKSTNAITSKTLILSGSSSATMSKKLAYSIDAAVSSMGINQNYSMEDKSIKESATKIIYRLEF